MLRGDMPIGDIFDQRRSNESDIYNRVMTSAVLPSRMITLVENRKAVGENKPFQQPPSGICSRTVPERGVEVAVHREPEREVPLLGEGHGGRERLREILRSDVPIM